MDRLFLAAALGGAAFAAVTLRRAWLEEVAEADWEEWGRGRW